MIQCVYSTVVQSQCYTRRHAVFKPSTNQPLKPSISLFQIHLFQSYACPQLACTNYQKCFENLGLHKLEKNTEINYKRVIFTFFHMCLSLYIYEYWIFCLIFHLCLIPIDLCTVFFIVSGWHFIELSIIIECALLFMMTLVVP